MPKVFVFITRPGKVLIGQGGRWLIDSVSPADKSRLAADQRSNNTNARAARIEIAGRRRNWGGQDTVVGPVVSKGSYFSGKFIDVRDANPPGFIKGDIEGKEKPLDAAIREVAEELSTVLQPSQFRQVHTQPEYTIFQVDLKDADADALYKSWKDDFDAGMAELVKLTWEPFASVPAMRLNFESKAVLTHLPIPKPGGRRTRRRRRVLKKPKTLKKRIR
jgi:8-oxo-dGTP pyrophosphatase MutT (NUDIX family)